MIDPPFGGGIYIFSFSPVPSSDPRCDGAGQIQVARTDAFIRRARSIHQKKHHACLYIFR